MLRRRTDEFGLSSILATSSYSYLDMDLDGDLDIITVPMNGPILVFRNNSQDGQSIAAQLRDHIGNSSGIGSKIFIYYGDPDEEQHQMRELQASGGFLSFDPFIAYFGLGDFNQVHRVEIQKFSDYLSRMLP